jgi:hypothetical protein
MHRSSRTRTRRSSSSMRKTELRWRRSAVRLASAQATYLQLAEEVRRADAVGDEAAPGAWSRRTPVSQEDRRGPVSRSRRCSRTSSNESSEACPEENAGRRGAGGLVGVHPPGLRGDPVLTRRPTATRSRRPGQAALEQRIKEICQTRVRFGYRRVHVLLQVGRAG